MIWLWIIAALTLSCMLLYKKKIELSYYIWLLVPLDANGINIAGATIKPYMIFAVIIFLIMCARNKGNDFDFSATKGQLLAGVICVLIFTISLIGYQSIQPVFTSILLLLIYLCAQMSTTVTRCDKSEQISDVFIASCFGCAAIYLVAYLCLKSGISIDGIVTLHREQPGMFMKMSNMSNGQYVEAFRLRGFAYDPNTMFLPFSFGISACVSRLFRKFNFYYVLTLIMSVVCIVLSSSRMGILCCVICFAVTCIVSILRFESVRKKILSSIAVLSMCAGFLVLLVSQFGQRLMGSLLSTYTNRASLTDEYGRFSIWEECLNVYWDENPLFGVGISQMSKITATERMTHNTWLEFICECGLIVGGLAVIYFLTIAIIGWVKTKTYHKIDPDNTSFLAVVIGYTMTLVALVSVDNITCSYLWFSGLLVLKMSQYATDTLYSRNLKN